MSRIVLFPSVSVSDQLATMLRRSGKRYDHGTPLPVDLNVSGHRQHGVFSTENRPVQTNGYPAWGWGGIASFLRKAERAGRQCVCGVKETVDWAGHVDPDINSGYGTDPLNKQD